jgi:transposase
VYLQQRWEEGCRNAGELYREIKEQGFTGTASWASRYISGLRKVADEPSFARAPAARRVASLLLCQAETLTADKQAFLAELCQKSVRIRTAWELAQQFLTMVQKRKGRMLGAWMEAVAQSGIEAMRGFVAKLRQDIDAVTNGLTLEWSNGQTEGQVNRLKLIKRSMYGRAKFDLLLARLLPMVQIA